MECVNKNMRKAYVELLSFLNIIDIESYNKIPKFFLQYLEDNKDPYYEKVVYINVPISQQNLMQETLELIAFLNIKYWSEDEVEKNELRKIYNNNKIT